ncbi:FAD-dependent oxidoreductase [Micromonospora sp. NPDC049101]|uniref:flavin monoamine oxidase family protein n=1 Tax=Micromonospora sp. NPDC049101 TaxID=3155032 RepID=UPI003404322C
MRNQHTAPTTALSGHRLSRRRFVQAAGLTAVAASAGTALGSPARADSPRTNRDVIVVGAGYAGVTAARELRAQGFRPVILEARSRIGGRTWTTTFEGKQIELGAQWIGPTQPLVNAEVRRYGLSTLTGSIPSRLLMPTLSGPAAVDLESSDARYGALMERLFAGARDLFPDPLNPLANRAAVVAADGLTLRDRLDQLGLTAEERLWLSGTTAGYSGGDSRLGAYTALAHWWALAGYNIAGYDAAMSLRISTGMTGLLQSMLNDAQAELHLRTAVASVTDTGGEVCVTTTAGVTYRAPWAVIAVPVNVWKTIAFRPGLAAVRARASAQGVGVPHSNKIWMKVTGLPDRVAARGTEGDPFTTLLSQGDVNGGQLMVAFNSLPPVDGTSVSAVQRALRYYLPEASVTSVLAQNWGTDRYSLGGWALRRPGQLSTQQPAIQTPQGRLAFASGDIATGWIGFVEGAIESGLRAAGQVAAMGTPALAAV